MATKPFLQQEDKKSPDQMLNSRFLKEKGYQRPIHFGIPEFHDAAVGSFVIRVPVRFL